MVHAHQRLKSAGGIRVTCGSVNASLERSAQSSIGDVQLSLADKAFFHFTCFIHFIHPSTGLSPGAADEVLLFLDLSHCIYADEI